MTESSINYDVHLHVGIRPEDLYPKGYSGHPLGGWNEGEGASPRGTSGLTILFAKSCFFFY